jgi:hypothetical protein
MDEKRMVHRAALPAKVVGVPLDYGNQVQLYGVVYALKRGPAATGSKEALREAVEKKVCDMWRTWRARVVELRRLRWPRPDTENREYWLGPYLCRPSGLIVEGRLSACHLASICPFCWMRELRESWERLDGLLREVPRRADYDIIVRRIVTKGVGEPRAWFINEKDRRARDISILRQLPKRCWAGVAWTTLRGFETSGWHGDTRQVLIIPRRSNFPLWSDGATVTAERFDARPWILRREVARMGRYPGFLMFGPPEVALEAYEARSNIRTRCCFGAARSKACPKASLVSDAGQSESIATPVR